MSDPIHPCKCLSDQRAEDRERAGAVALAAADLLRTAADCPSTWSAVREGALELLRLSSRHARPI